jgi:hypothetical protein
MENFFIVYHQGRPWETHTDVSTFVHKIEFLDVHMVWAKM